MSFKTTSFLFLSFLLFAVSCKSTKRASSNNTITKRNFQDSLRFQLEANPLFEKIFTGFALYDPDKEATILESNADKYYTPASNTKIFTLYAASQILGDSIPGLKYETRNDSLFFWGTGDPTLLFPYISDTSQIIDFLKSRKEKLIYCPGNFDDDAFGAGWAWSDYYYSYQTEKTPLPIYGNYVQVVGHPIWDSLDVRPTYFRSNFRRDTEVRSVERAPQDNIFYINPDRAKSFDFKRNVPFFLYA